MEQNQTKPESSIIRYSLAILVLAAILLAALLMTRAANPEDQTFNSGAVQNSKSLPRQDDETGDVFISIEPVKIDTAGGDNWEFLVTLSTHSLELDQDLTQIVYLKDGSNNIYKPLAYDGPPPGGHHREGTLIFKPIKPVPGYIIIEVRNVNDAPSIFKWEL